jgi:hypothetical protein
MVIGKALMIYGSPRGENSSSAVFGREVARGLEKAGTELFEVILTENNIHPCTGCYTCWMKTPGQCVFKDDVGATRTGPSPCSSPFSWSAAAERGTPTAFLAARARASWAGRTSPG